MAVTPVPADATAVAVGGSPVNAIVATPGGIGGGFIQNPVAPADQGLANTEPLYVDPTGNPATLAGNGSTFRLEAGQTWTAIVGQTTATSVNATSSGHKFSGVKW